MNICLTHQMVQNRKYKKRRNKNSRLQQIEKHTGCNRSLPAWSGESGFTSLQALIFSATNPLSSSGVESIIVYFLLKNAIL